MKILRESLICLLLVIFCGVGFRTAMLLQVAEQTAKQTPQAVAETRQAAQDEIRATRKDLIEQVAGIRADLRSVAQTADRRAGEALAIVRTTAASADTQIGWARQDLNGQLTTLNQTVAVTAAPVGQLAARYALLPDQLSAAVQPSWSALEPEFTCRRPDGSGYGGCAHSRVNALLGEAARAGGAFAKDFPMLSGSITGIAADAHTFTSRAVAPCRGWCLARSVLTTGSGAVRAAGAAGVF